MSDFGDLLQAAEQLTAEFVPSSASSDLPRVERNLHQIVEAGQQLFAKTSRDLGTSTASFGSSQGGALSSQDVRAAILLGSKGIDLPSMSHKLDSLSTFAASAGAAPAVSASVLAPGLTSFEPPEPIRDTDVAGFLRNERENALLSVIEETRKDTFESAEKQHWEAVSSEWEADKQRILGALAGTEASASDLSQSILVRTETSRVHESTLGTRSALDAVEMAYAQQVGLYNEDLARGGLRPNLTNKLSSLFPEERDAEVALMWEMVARMSELTPPTCSVDAVKHRTGVATSRAIVNKSKSYLEAAFLKFVKSTVFTNLQKAQLGGIPGTYHLVKSFLHVKVAPNTPGLEDGLVDGVPVWPLIFYCLRSGDVPAAVQAATEAGHGLSEVHKLLNEVASSADRRLSPHTENMVRIAYKRSVRSTTDPYKRAVYCLLAACDPADEHGEVATSLDDYLWIKLAQIREAGEGEGCAETLNLAALQRLMSEDYGETHFNAYEQPMLYFQVLLLTGQWEAAFEFLFRIDRLRAHSVHMTLAMYESGLLLLPQGIQAPLLTPAAQQNTMAKRLNVARLVLLYVRKFESTDPKEALHYFYFLRHLRTEGDSSSKKNLFMSCVSELVLESREFDLLLGQILADGSRSPGLIDRFDGGGGGGGSSQVDVHRIIEMVAEDSETKGMFEDSVKLYDLAKKHDKVIELLNKLLAQVISLAPIPESRRDRLQRQAVDIAKRYRANGHSAGSENTSAFFLLLDLMTFFDLFHAKKYDEALDIVTKIKIVPLSQGEIDLMVSNFRMLTDEVRRNIPDILLASMNVLFTKYKQTKSTTSGRGVGQDGGRERHLENLRDQAKAIITFAGMIPYRMPGDTNARLVQMEVLMN